MKKTFAKLTKKTLSILPPTMPAKIYNAMIKVPALKQLANSLIKSAIPDCLETEEWKLLLDKDDVAMSGYLALGSYEPETIRIFKESMKEGATVVDIGTNIGYYTIIAGKKVGPMGKVFGYEPNTDSFNLLQRNILINNFDNITPVNMALSNILGERVLYFGDNKCTHSFADNRKTGKNEMVPTDTLDNSLKKYGSPKIDVIKMDIEGAEILALEGMTETIERSPELVIFTELYPKAIRRLGKSPIELLEKMRDLGFSISVIDEDRKDIVTLSDFGSFISSFRDDESYKNLYAVKE
mgnify:CR=1 FL=1